jgi:arylsulfatase A-like enzyme
MSGLIYSCKPLIYFLVVFPVIQGCKIEPQSKPNIILCMADDQGWGDMAYNGHPELITPNFDDLAASGLCFDRFYAAAPVCSPTRGSVMTGRHPNRFGCFRWGHTLRPQEVTLAEALKKAGYVTGHFGKWHLGSVYAGSPVNPGASGFDEWYSTPNYFENDAIFSHKGIAGQTHGEGSMVTVDAAIGFIGENKNGPFPIFAVIWFGSPHSPHIAIERDLNLYSHVEDRLRHFYGEITAMDRAVGRLRQELKEMGIAENTLLWYTSDNGGIRDLGSTGGRGAKGSIYEGGLRVPAVIEWPAAVTVPRKTDFPASTSDIYPTLLEIAGVTVENQPGIDGISLLPVIDNRMHERDEPIGFWQYPASGMGVPGNQIMLDLLKMQEMGEEPEPGMLDPDVGDIKKIYSTDSLPGHSAWLKWPFKLHRIENGSGEITLELYNLESDPWEQNNIAFSDPVLAESMSDQLEKWQVSVIESLNGSDYE